MFIALVFYGCQYEDYLFHLHKLTLAEVMHIAISIIFGLCFIGLLVLAMIDGTAHWPHKINLWLTTSG